MKYCLSVAIMMVCYGWALAQNADWIDQMEDPDVNFYTVQKSFEQYWQGREIEKGKGWKQFKRWEVSAKQNNRSGSFQLLSIHNPK